MSLLRSSNLSQHLFLQTYCSFGAIFKHYTFEYFKKFIDFIPKKTV